MTALNDKYNLENALDIRIITSFNSYMQYNFFHKENALSYCKARKSICDLLKKMPYNTAIKKIKFSQLNIHEKIFIFCIKFNLIEVLYLFYKIKKI
jgi:hypothetical protein